MKLKKIKVFLIGKTIGFLLLILGKTWRYTVFNRHNIDIARSKSSSVIFATWHGRLIQSIYYTYNWKYRWNIYALVSPSGDGEIANYVLRKFKWKTVRGDSKYRSSDSLEELIELVNAGYDIGMVPDGPLGPRYKAKYGTVKIASASCSPIVPVIATSTKVITFKSWDQLMLPLPFSRVYIMFCNPIEVPENLNKEEIGYYNEQLENSLNKGLNYLDLLRVTQTHQYTSSMKKNDNYIDKRDYRIELPD